jgi:HSP90 family molecular chaperone
MAPVRELIQNSLDAVLLKRAVSTSAPEKLAATLPIEVHLQEREGASSLVVTDWGIGMSKEVITDHLITIASDYWDTRFHTDFPTAPEDFTPAGRFGIGFLSVFMLGHQITVSSQRSGKERFQLTIRGLGKRAELRTLPAGAASGTTVSVQLSKESAEALHGLLDTLPSFIPMLEVPVSVTFKGQTTTIQPAWAMNLAPLEFKKWVTDAAIALRPEQAQFRRAGLDQYIFGRYFDPRELGSTLAVYVRIVDKPERASDEGQVSFPIRCERNDALRA